MPLANLDYHRRVPPKLSAIWRLTVAAVEAFRTGDMASVKAVERNHLEGLADVTRRAMINA